LGVILFLRGRKVKDIRRPDQNGGGWGGVVAALQTTRRKGKGFGHRRRTVPLRQNLGRNPGRTLALISDEPEGEG